jgi:hypothetical protein
VLKENYFNSIKIMKKSLVALALVVLIGFSACGRRYTCPTYLKNDTNSKDIRVKVENKQKDSAKS